jgi:hypothetical protein
MKKYFQRFLCVFLVFSFFIFPFAKRKVYAAGPTDPLTIEKILFFFVMAGGTATALGCSQKENSARVTISWQAFKNSLTSTPPPPWFSDYINARKGLNIVAWTITKEEFTKLYNYFRGCITKGNKKSVGATSPSDAASVPASFPCQYPSYDNTDIINYFEKGAFVSPFEITYTTYNLHFLGDNFTTASLSGWNDSGLLTVIVIRSPVFCRIIYKLFNLKRGIMYHDAISPSNLPYIRSNGSTQNSSTPMYYLLRVALRCNC